ncbi:MAG: transporter substrate-binding domain-containing protein [Deltaproteobacteria bacterium]|nr:transporter substrate-binding domain-containing protein [Deltaproteobacteria bacterium]
MSTAWRFRLGKCCSGVAGFRKTFSIYLVTALMLNFVVGCSAEDASQQTAPPVGDSSSSTKTKSALLDDKTKVSQPPVLYKSFVDIADLKKMQERKLLRVLTLEQRGSFLQAGGVDDRVLVQEFASANGMQIQFLESNTLKGLFERLAKGEGDLIAARISATKERKKKIAFARPTRVIDEVIVGRQDASVSNFKELAGKNVKVWRNSAHVSALQKRMAKEKVEFQIEQAEAGVDDETLLAQVAAKEAEFTVADSDTFTAAQLYTPGLKILFKLREDVEIAWAVRLENPKLKAAADRFVIEKALTEHSEKVLIGDLDAIQKRGSIRMITRNNPVTYFLHRGQARGFDYDLAKLVAKKLKVRLEVVVPPEASQLISWLNEGKGDFIAASFTVNEERKKHVHFSTPYLFVDEVLVGPKVLKPAANQEELKAMLAGKKVLVRKSSSYYFTLLALQKEMGTAFEITLADEGLETEEILKMVQRKKEGSDFTVSDSHILAVEQTYSDDLVRIYDLTHAEKDAVDPKGKPRVGAKELAFATRKSSTKLQTFLDTFVKRTYRGLEYNVARKQYFQNKRRMLQAKASTAHKGKISAYDDVIKKYSEKYGLDWRLMAAQAFQESRFNPKAKSWVGAKGLFQVMPATGKEMGFIDLENPDIGTHAGVRYLSKMIRAFDKKIPFKQRIRFALASYNAGRGHVLDAMRLARQQGLDPHKWFGNVEKTMLQLADRRVAKRVRHGYCRGQEPVNYVSQIQLRYDNWVKVIEEK